MRNKQKLKAEIIRNRTKMNTLMRTMEKSSLSHYAQNLRELKELVRRNNKLKIELKGE